MPAYELFVNGNIGQSTSEIWASLLLPVSRIAFGLLNLRSSYSTFSNI